MNKGRSFMSGSGLIVSYSPVLAEKIITPEDSAKNGVQTNRTKVQLRQAVDTTYPAARGNDLFSGQEIAGSAGQKFTEQRVTWLNVKPGVTIAEVQAKLDGMDSPTLVKTLGLKPILSEDQLRTIDNGTNPKSLEDYHKDFVIQPDGQPALFRGKLQYRKISFSKSVAEDNDNRAIDFKELYGNQAVELAVGEGSKIPSKL